MVTLQAGGQTAVTVGELYFLRARELLYYLMLMVDPNSNDAGVLLLD
jgi:hypothetical protein